MVKNKREEVYLSVINELVKEKSELEERLKNPLPEGWIRAKDHPRIGEVLALFPNILTTN
jgi:hypothetical protein